jgi:MFS family permease
VTTSETNSTARTRAFWLLAFAALVLARLALPFLASDTMRVHAAVVDSLITGHNWGRQALVGTLEYPVLPTLALLLARVIAAPLRMDAGLLLTAACQAWAILYAMRLATTARQRLAVGVGLFFALASGDVLDAFATADPNWVIAPLFGAVVYHLTLWHRSQDLRDAVLAAANAGVLALAGPVGIVLGLALLAGMGQFLDRSATGPAEDRDGLKWLIWTPFCYGILLLFLWNWLIMDSPLFFLGHLFQTMHGKSTGGVIEYAFRALGSELGWFPLAAMLAASLCLHPGHPRRVSASALTVGLLAVVAMRSLGTSLSLYPAGAGILLASGSLGLISLALAGMDWQGHRSRVALGLVVLLAAIVISRIYPAHPLTDEARFADEAPPRAEIEGYIDQYWPDSRVAVYGLRPAAIYHDPYERRFVARIDFHEGVFLDQARDEIVHLLLPPDNGLYYPQGMEPFSRISTEGKPWLLLEKTWPSGWQLWRCVIAPTRHSLLEDL